MFVWTWRRSVGHRLLRVEVVIQRPTWRPRWIWIALDSVLPAFQAMEGDATNPVGLLVGLRALEGSRLGTMVEVAGATVYLLDSLLNFVLPWPIVSRRSKAYGVRWLGTSIYTTRGN